jgi:GntR family transcriptional regulator/MocR family aminotransferase
MAAPGSSTVFARLLTGDSTIPLFQQIYDGLRAAILRGQLRPGTRLPASRTLAVDLGVSRATIVTAIEQLAAEGYLSGRHGSGTFVAPAIPDQAFRAPRPRPTVPPRRPARGLSRRGERLAQPRAVPCRPPTPSPFRPGTPALDVFPWDEWDRLARRRWRSRDRELLAYGEPAGYGPLREAVAAHVGVVRGVRCTADQVLIVSGLQQALGLVAQVLLDPGEAAWMEDPGYIHGQASLLAAGVVPRAIPVDADGLDPEAGTAICPNARLCYVTPSHQYPTGVTLTLARRLALLSWARSADAWVVEDDYDSEFRFEGRPLASLAGLDPDGRVLYLGTFSKSLFPSLRLAYLIVPRDLAGPFARARDTLDQYTSTWLQAVTADFLMEGCFARHLRRMRTLYAERQAALVRAIRRAFGGEVEVSPTPAGLHLLGWLPDGVDDRAVTRRARAAGLEVPPLSAYRMGRPGRGGLVMGFAAYPPRAIRDGVRQLAAVWRADN